MHLEDEYISSDSIESFFIVRVDRDISREEFGMILGGDSDIAGFEKIQRPVRYSSRADFIENCEKRIFSVFSVILAKLCREDARDEASLTPDRMLEGELDSGRVS